MRTEELQRVTGDSLPRRVAAIVAHRRLLALAAVVSVGALVPLALAYAPEDLEQGPPQRIFYIHVPAAWIAFLAFGVVFGASIAMLRTRRLQYDRLAAASAEVGVVFTTIVMVTGPLWARPVWGLYWSWDPRLTSVFILWLIYCSYLALRGYVPDPMRRARFSAVLGILGFLDVPLIYVSVKWWRALHPGPMVITPEGPQMPGSMVMVLLVGVASFTLLYLALLGARLSFRRPTDPAEEVTR